MLPTQWRLVRTAAAEGSWNMAFDLALMDVARTSGDGFLRIYGWTSPTVSFGRHERTAGLYSAVNLAAAGLAAVRRPTGGRALLHDREITYSVAIPVADGVRWREAYDQINKVLLSALLALGIPARLVSAPANPYTDGAVCFSGVAPGEIAVGAQKLVASAVWRERGAYLQHGSILMFDDQKRLSALVGAGVARPEPAAVLSKWLGGSVTLEHAANLVAAALKSELERFGNVTPWTIPIEADAVIRATAETLAQPQWLWRR